MFNYNSSKAFGFAFGATAICASVFAAHPAHAATGGAVIAQDTAAPPVLAPDAMLVGVDANVPNGLTVTGARGKLVTVSAKGEASRTATAAATAPVVIRNLTPGKAYNVAIGGVRIGTATPLSAPAAAYGLTVATTDITGEVILTWQQQAKSTQGQLTYDVAATPQTASTRATDRSTATMLPVTMKSQLTTARLTGLNAQTLYTFSVVPRNTAAVGAGTSATMNQPLASLTGTPTPVVSAPVVVAAPAPEPAPAAVPAPAPGPTTKTIYVCPDGFVDGGTLCTKTLAYTFHAVTTTSAYTYHQQFVQTGSHITFSSDGSNGGTYYPKDAWNSTDGSAEGFYAVIPDGYYTSVKDAPPTGYTDNGSTYSKTEQVKDALPTGYSDNGSTWVMTAAKVAKVVPA